VAHVYVGNLFQQNELRIAQYLAVLAGAALDNASETEERQRVAIELKRAKETAEAASGVKSQFLANMSHEMRTPISAMLGYLQFLKDGDLTESERKHFIATIERNGVQLTHLVDDILDLSKVEAGYLRLESSEVKLTE